MGSGPGGLTSKDKLIISSLFLAGAASGLAVSVFRGGLYQATRPHWWAAYNLYKEQADIRHAMSGGKFKLGTTLTYRPLGLKGFMHRIIPVALPFPWFDFQGIHVEGSSLESYQQNGGPLTPPSLVVTDDWRESLGDPSPISQGKPTRKLRGRGRSVVNPRKGERCPPGYYWHAGKRACVLNKYSPHWKR